MKYLKKAISYGAVAPFLEIFSIIPVVRFRVKEQAFNFVLINFSKVFLQYVLILILIVFYDYGLLGYYYDSLLPLIPMTIIYFILPFLALAGVWSGGRRGMLRA